MTVLEIFLAAWRGGSGEKRGPLILEDRGGTLNIRG